MKVIFSHGKESGPWGRKISHLADLAKAQGLAVESVDYRASLDPEWRVEHLLSVLNGDSADDSILVGSSMGGYVSTVVAQQLKLKGLFLMAPAFYLSGYAEQALQCPRCPVSIVHGWHDDVVPVDNTIRFAKENHSDLHVIASDHGLGDSLDTVGKIFTDFIINIIHRY